MKRQTIAIDTPYVRPDAYGALSLPIYNNVAFEFGDAQQMADAFCNHLESQEACYRFLNRLKLIHRATNLFDNRTLAIHPASTIFGLFPERQLQQMDVRQTTVRLSVGLEDVGDLLADIEQALCVG